NNSLPENKLSFDTSYDTLSTSSKSSSNFLQKTVTRSTSYGPLDNYI
ncbi:8317_t:CDS:2, partial [Funneliformis geosporum]